MHYDHKFSPRRWFGLATILLLATFGFSTVSNQASAAQVLKARDSAGTRSTLEIQVNYTQDWVAGITDPGETVSITLEDNISMLKGEAEVSADGATGDFFVACEDWNSGWCPDIVPGDHLSVSTLGQSGEINPIGAILIDNLDADFDTVSGTLDVDEFPGTQLDVTCEIWEELGPTLTTQAQADGGEFTCDFDTKWDIQPNDTIAVSYDEPDGNRVTTTIVEWPWMWVDFSTNQVGGNYHAGQNLTINLKDSGNATRAITKVTSDWSGGWGGAEGFVTETWGWYPTAPEIIPGDRADIVSDNGYTHTIEAGVIEAEVDAALDQVSGTITAPPDITDPLTVECHPWGAWEAGIGDATIKESSAAPDGSVEFLCQWDPTTEWDIQPGQEIGVMYIEPEGDRVIDVFEEPAPYLRVDKQGFGDLTQDGNAHYRITLWNEGSAPAENVVLTDAMDGLTYLTDTSGLAHTGTSAGPIIWEVGTLNPGQSIQFHLFGQVTASEIVTNTVSVTTNTTSDQGDPSEKTAVWDNAVIQNDTTLQVSKHALTNNPTQGQDMVFVLDVCNQGATASSTVTLSDELDPPLSFVDWWSYEAGWTEQSSDSSTLVLSRPTLDGGACSTVYLRAHVASTANFGDQLINTAQIDAANDLSPNDNEAIWEGEVDQPQKNVRIDKGWIRGQLVHGGEIHYLLRYENTGNVPLGSMILRDTFPINTTFLDTWIIDPWGKTSLVPDSLSDTGAEWQLPEIENGASVEIEVALAIDPDAEPGTLLVNSATIDPLPGESNQNDNAAQWSEVIYPALPNLRVHKWQEWQGDGLLLYRIQFENIGSEQVEDIQLTDTLPVDMEWDEWQMVECGQYGGYEYVDGTFHWNFGKLLPGESCQIFFQANLTEPDTLFRWYTNTVEITIPEGDPSPGDNYAETTAFSGSDMRSIAFWLNPNGASNMWGEALPGSMVTVTTPLDTFSTSADPECGGCWQIEDVGLLIPGDVVIISTDQELPPEEDPIEVTIPNPFSATVNSTTDEASGQVGGWSEQPVEIHGEWPSGFQEVLSDPSGYFSTFFPDIPYGGSGYVRVVDQVRYAEVSYHLPFETSDIILEVNYSHDGVEGAYQPGHTLWLTVTNQVGKVKATAELETQEIPWWEPGQTGFSTHLGSPWNQEVPDIVPGDWVYAEMDNGHTAEVQIGEINGTLDISNDTVEGDVYLDWLSATLQGRCSVWEEGGPTIAFEVEADHGFYKCDLGAQGWDLQHDHHVAVMYQNPIGHWVIKVFQKGWQIYLPLVLRNN